ncbi:MAG: RNA 2',3'-cyclic phosphodiesterase [Bacillota bacterium]
MSKRLFIAIPVEGRTKKLLKQNINKAQKSLDYNLKWVSGENLHLTLKFLGNTKVEKIEEIKSTLSNTCSHFNTLNIFYNFFGAFPSTDYPKVLFFGLNGDIKRLKVLQSELVNSLAKAGFEKENREYTPHLTFARTRKSTNINKLKVDYNDFINKNDLRVFQKVNTISLIESKLYKTGPVYEEIFSINLT